MMHKKVEPSADLVSRQLLFFRCLHRDHKPAKIARLDAHSYEYEYVHGRHPEDNADLMAVLYAAMTAIWKNGKRSPCQIEQYLSYMGGMCKGRHGAAVARLKNYPCSPAAIAHGDLTLENVLIKGSNPATVVFIDPGFSHGFDVVELDEAKMLQSIVTQWEKIHRGWKPCTLIAPFAVQPAHIILLLTHWLRLLRHAAKHSNKVNTYGVQHVIPMLLKEIEDDFPSCRVRSGWGLAELQDRCIRVLQTRFC